MFWLDVWDVLITKSVTDCIPTIKGVLKLQRVSWLQIWKAFCYNLFPAKCRAELPDYGDLLRIPESHKIDHIIDEDSGYAVFVSYVEIYNNYVYDLLEDTPLDPLKAK